MGTVWAALLDWTGAVAGPPGDGAAVVSGVAVMVTSGSRGAVVAGRVAASAAGRRPGVGATLVDLRDSLNPSILIPSSHAQGRRTLHRCHPQP